MKTENLAVRTLVLIAGVFIMAFGVSISICSGLGTTPISSVPYVSNIAFPEISVGTFTILLNVFFVLLQMLILRQNYKFIQLLQIPLIIVFGWFIDVHLSWTVNFIPANYLQQWIYCLLSCLIIALGIFLQVKADVSILLGEGFVMAIAKTTKKDFGFIKILFDSLLVVVALIAVFIFLDKLEGVREGTIVSALLVGFIVEFYKKHLTCIDKIVYPDKVVEFIEEPYMSTDNFVITISRQYGSGGHAVGELVAKKLGIEFYDSKLIDLTAEESGFTKEYVKKHEQKLTNSLLYKLYKQNYAYINEAVPPQDMLFMVQTRVIRDIATKSSCVIVGRCADYILKGHPNCFNVFVHANDAFRKSRAITEYGIHPDDAEKEMERKDKERKNYNEHYTGRKWADLKDFDMTVETSLFGIDITAAMIIDARRKAMYT
ncbi:MAG TPA: cytidylate kinase family protein [Bacteroidales bacterium]|nr:cytidylate kinase family protein [Bacteroidales bacterium]